MKTPEGFAEIRTEEAHAFVRPEARSWVEEALERHGSLHRAAAASPHAIRMQGRGPVYAVPAQPDEVQAALGEDPGRWVVRHYHRGGAVARFLGDRYLRVGTPRPFRELEASEAVRERRIPTPRVVAAVVHPAGAFYRGDLATRYISEATELAHVLFDPDRRGLSGTVDRRDALAETGVLIRAMADHGVVHPDLNARNVLLEWSGGAPDAYLLDLDGCRVEDRPRPEAARSMQARLVRSIRKLGEKAGLPVPEGDLRALARGVGA